MKFFFKTQSSDARIVLNIREKTRNAEIFLQCNADKTRKIHFLNSSFIIFLFYSIQPTFFRHSSACFFRSFKSVGGFCSSSKACFLMISICSCKEFKPTDFLRSFTETGSMSLPLWQSYASNNFWQTYTSKNLVIVV